MTMEAPSPPPAQGTVKLRGSCHACALSKLKCSQDKPTCARCAKRGTTCQYLASKRAGRKQGSRSGSVKSPVKATATRPTDERTEVLAASTPLMQYALQQDRNLDNHREQKQHHHHYRTPSYPDSLPSALSSAGPTTSATSPLSFNPDFDTFLASPLSLSMLDIPDSDYFAGSELNFTSLPDPTSFLIPEHPIPLFEDTPPKLPGSSNTPLLPLLNDLSPPFSSTDALHSPASAREEPQSCLVRSLSLLQNLFPGAALECSTASPEDGDRESAASTHHPPTIQAVITKNDQTIQDITQILDCPCSYDSYTLAILTLTVFKVLAWYGAAAQQQKQVNPEENQHTHTTVLDEHQRWGRRLSEQVVRAPAVIGSYRVDGEDQGRMAAQLVLSELHRVQRLVNTLSLRLREQGRLMGLGGDQASIESFLPGRLLEQLAVDLRGRLRGLSAEIVGLLRG